MARLSEEFISQVKAANDIVDLFRIYADVKKRGRIYVCCCPFHSEKTPSCTIYPENNSFYCFGCHAGGDVIKFTMLTDNVNYIEAVKILAQRCGMTMPAFSPEEKQQSQFRDKCYEINRETANFYYLNLLKGTDRQGLQYLKSMQIRPETVQKYALGYAPDDTQSLYHHLRKKGYSDKELLVSGVCRKSRNTGIYDTFQNCIIFPAVDFRGNVTAFGGKPLNPPGSPELYTDRSPVSDKNKLIFSLNTAKKEMTAKSLILAENYFSAAAVYQAGFANVIAVPEIVTFHHIKAITQYAEELLLISSPASHYGQVQNIRNQCSEAGINLRIVSLPEASDSADFLRTHDIDSFRTLLVNAGDAVQTALQNSWEHLDTEQDKTVMIQESAKILAGIRNPLEREIYLNETARKLNLTPEQMQNQIDRFYHKTIKIQTTNSRFLEKSELLLQNPHNPGKIKAEQQLLVYLIRYPEEISNIRQKLSPEEFVSDSDRNLYRQICGADGNLPEYPPELQEILKDYQELEINAEAADDFIQKLKNSKKRRIL
ncbi:MAG: DNA primase [Oscillospiraceae bacterium]|nr:DNA primase [Oscillospiraceae bacterium]